MRTQCVRVKGKLYPPLQNNMLTKCWFFLLIPRFNQLMASQSFTQREGEGRIWMWSAYWLATKPNQRLCAKMQQPDREESCSARRVCIWGLWRRAPVSEAFDRTKTLSFCSASWKRHKQSALRSCPVKEQNKCCQTMLAWLYICVCVCMHVSIHARSQTHRGREGGRCIVSPAHPSFRLMCCAARLHLSHPSNK